MMPPPNFDETYPEYNAKIDKYASLIASGEKKWIEPLAHAYAGRGGLLLHLGEFSAALADYKLAINSFNQLPDGGQLTSPKHLVFTKISLAKTLFYSGYLSQAYHSYDLVIADYLNGQYQCDENLAHALVDRAQSLHFLGRYQEAVANYEAAIEKYASLLDANQTLWSEYIVHARALQVFSINAIRQIPDITTKTKASLRETIKLKTAYQMELAMACIEQTIVECRDFPFIENYDWRDEISKVLLDILSSCVLNSGDLIRGLDAVECLYRVQETRIVDFTPFPEEFYEREFVSEWVREWGGHKKIYDEERFSKAFYDDDRILNIAFCRARIFELLGRIDQAIAEYNSIISEAEKQKDRWENVLEAALYCRAEANAKKYDIALGLNRLSNNYSLASRDFMKFHLLQMERKENGGQRNIRAHNRMRILLFVIYLRLGKAIDASVVRNELLTTPNYLGKKYQKYEDANLPQPSVEHLLDEFIASLLYEVNLPDYFVEQTTLLAHLVTEQNIAHGEAIAKLDSLIHVAHQAEHPTYWRRRALIQIRLTRLSWLPSLCDDIEEITAIFRCATDQDSPIIASHLADLSELVEIHCNEVFYESNLIDQVWLSANQGMSAIQATNTAYIGDGNMANKVMGDVRRFWKSWLSIALKLVRFDVALEVTCRAHGGITTMATLADLVLSNEKCTLHPDEIQCVQTLKEFTKIELSLRTETGHEKSIMAKLETSRMNKSNDPDLALIVRLRELAIELKKIEKKYSKPMAC